MPSKLKTIYLHHFKLVLFLNFCLSLFFGYLFFLKGFDKAPLYSIALFFKLVAYGTTVSIEKLFFSVRNYYYRNLGLSYRRIFSVLFAVDMMLFISLLVVVALCRNFI
jgi:hypothetical protein